MSLPDYRTQTYWKKYQPFFPAHAQVTDDTAPDEEWFEWRGHSIHLDRYPMAESALTVIMVHGAGGYGRLLAPIGRIIKNAGYEVIAPDLPGYGLTRAETSSITYGAWVEMLCDLVVAEHKKNNRPVVLCGGSLGGYVAYLCAAALGATGPIAGIIATTLADPRQPISQKQFARNAVILKFGLPLLPIFARVAGSLKLPIKWFTKMNAMSNNMALSKLIAHDPLGGGTKVPINFMNSIFTVKPAIEPEQFELCPVLLAHPAADHWTHIDSSQPFFDRLKGKKSLVLLENCGHFPIESPGLEKLEETASNWLGAIATQAGIHH